MYNEKIVTIKRVPQDRIPNEIYESSTKSIGSAIDATTGGVLKGLNFAEERILMPSIVNTPATSMYFLEQVDKFWMNIEIKVPIDTGLNLNIGTYPVKVAGFKKGDIAKGSPSLKGKIDIFDFPTGDIQEEASAGEALAVKEAIVVEEDDAEMFDMPYNILDYIYYRYALVNNEVADSLQNAIAFGKQFYIEDKEVEEGIEFAKITLVAKARKAIERFLPNVENLDDVKTNDFKSLYAIARLTKDKHTLKITNDTKNIFKTIYSLCELIPEDVIALANDKLLKTKMFVEDLINFGVIETFDNKFYDKKIGSDPIAQDLEEFVKFVNLPTNKAVAARYRATLEQKVRQQS